MCIQGHGYLDNLLCTLGVHYSSVGDGTKTKGTGFCVCIDVCSINIMRKLTVLLSVSVHTSVFSKKLYW